jgi:hypothetical protein
MNDTVWISLQLGSNFLASNLLIDEAHLIHYLIAVVVSLGQW